MATAGSTLICITAPCSDLDWLYAALAADAALAAQYTLCHRPDALGWPAREWRKAEKTADRLRALLVMRDPVSIMWRQGGAVHWPPSPKSIDYGDTLNALQSGLLMGTWCAIFAEDIEDDPSGAMQGIGQFLDIEPPALRRCPRLSKPPTPPRSIAAQAARVIHGIEAAGISAPDRWRHGLRHAPPSSIARNPSR